MGSCRDVTSDSILKLSNNFRSMHQRFFSPEFFPYTYVHIYVYIYIYMCRHIYIYIYIYTYIILLSFAENK